MKPNEKVIARSNLFELVGLPQPDGRIFEVARRAPGVRVIIADETSKRVLLTKEFRRELNDFDWRLPGGKVFDSLAEYEEFRKSGKDIMPFAAAKAKAEAAEEAGMEVDDLLFVKRSTLGATVEWDLYIFETLTSRKHAKGQQLEAGEVVESAEWRDAKHVEEMILEGKMQEERVALALQQWLYKKGWLSR